MVSALYRDAQTPVMCVMDHTGDKKITWDKQNADDVKRARAEFNRLRRQGYAAFAEDSQLLKFDPDAERIVMVPPFQGG